jgi:hypothetical protein
VRAGDDVLSLSKDESRRGREHFAESELAKDYA